MAVDSIRHLKVFDARTYSRPVHIIGAGATGSFLALQAAKLGIEDLHVWDFDQIEEHNLANQLYGPEHIGSFKVDALAQVIKEQADIDIQAHKEKVDKQRLEGAVFLLTDTMASRKEIFNNCIRYKYGVDIMIETRMGAQTCEVHSIYPLNPVEVKGWEGRWFPDDEERVSASDCGARTTIGATASMLASASIWQFIKHANNKPVENWLFMSVEPFMIETLNY